MNHSPEERLVETRRRTEGLRRWCEARGRGAISFLALETGRTFAAIARVVHGRAQPNTETALAIESATGRDVTAAELLGIGPPVATNGASSSEAAE